MAKFKKLNIQNDSNASIQNSIKNKKGRGWEKDYQTTAQLN